ncbi:hypothetical protein ACPESV_16660 [Streptomyces umbrinus]|uniref:hypothetical protein n=1 Tax=Streptomyces umbrinus TaxID=67370 RepID=UPI003C2FA412
MTHRSIEALGFTDVPALQPLTYPGRIIDEPVLLSGKELLALRVRRQRLGGWLVDCGDVPGEETLDSALDRLGQASAGSRYPVISVGSNAAPGQVSHKFGRIGIADAMPMIPVRVRGVSVGLSAHISPAGYVAAAPYLDPEAETPLVVTWLDAAQLKVVDDTEFPGYRRALLPGDAFPMVMPSGERLGGAYIYFSAHGVLADRNGAPRPGGRDQAALLRELLSESRALRELLGPDPESWVRRAGADEAVRDNGTGVFREEGWLTLQPEFLPYESDDSELRLYDDLPALDGSLPNP